MTADPNITPTGHTPADAFQVFFEAEDRTMPRPKDQDQDEPNTPSATQTRTLAWTGYALTMRELRSWIDQLPNHATLMVDTAYDDPEQSITATWEVTQ